MDVVIENSWKEQLNQEFEQPYFLHLVRRIKEEFLNPQLKIYPPGNKIFSAFDSTPFQDVKVVIVGQDPYHGPNQANGLCFSVNQGINLPPSLQNIFKEINSDIGTPIPSNGDLSRWAMQGVFLLNSVLTVRAHSPKSHSGIGWETFTDRVVHLLAEKRKNLVFLLWGSDAIRKGNFIDRSRHLVLTAPHPSPLSAYRGFLGCKHFSKANQYLIEHDKKPIIW